MTARSRIGPAARRGLRLAARGYDRVARPPAGAVVLAYHQVGAPTPGSVNLTVASFAEQVAMLASGSELRPVVDLDRLVEAVAGAGSGDGTGTGTGDDDPEVPRPEAMVAITFDDGTADFVDRAVPVLVDHDLPVTLYLATAHVDEGRSFWDDGTVLSWSALRDAHSTGLVTIGSHTHDHILLDRTDPNAVADDIDRSIARIEDEIGVRPRHFAYPKALAPTAAAKAVVRSRFASAALAGGRPNRVGATDRWALDRTPVVAADDLGDVDRKASGGLRLEGVVRSGVDRIRYRGATR